MNTQNNKKEGNEPTLISLQIDMAGKHGRTKKSDMEQHSEFSLTTNKKT